MLEIARVLGSQKEKPKVTYRLVFFDGEEAFCENWSDCGDEDSPDNTYGSRHTDAILSQDTRAIERFTRDVDTASVMVNTSTRFADGGEYGLGAEIGISTDKFHARGPCGLEELTSYKYVVHGKGQIRE